MTSPYRSPTHNCWKPPRRLRLSVDSPTKNGCKGPFRKVWVPFSNPLRKERPLSCGRSAIFLPRRGLLLGQNSGLLPGKGALGLRSSPHLPLRRLIFEMPLGSGLRSNHLPSHLSLPLFLRRSSASAKAKLPVRMVGLMPSSAN